LGLKERNIRRMEKIIWRRDSYFMPITKIYQDYKIKEIKIIGENGAHGKEERHMHFNGEL
jgi:hypothetical protein